MRGKLEALMEDLLDTAKVSRCPDYADGIRHAVDCLRALLATEPQRVRMEPQPKHWDEKNRTVLLRDSDCQWGIFYRPEHGGLAVEIYTAPSPDHVPVEINGVWWWEVPHDPR